MNKIAIRYILGRSGSGKSHRILQEIKQCLQNGGEERLILLVPEQFTLQSERDLIEKLELPGIMRVEVLSFTRLAGRVFNEVGGLTRTLLNEQGKSMVLRKMIDELGQKLSIYKKAAQKDGFITKFGDLVSELKQHNIEPAQLTASMQGQEEIIIKQKINDIALIYERFNQYLLDRYLDTEDYLNLFVEKIDEAGIIKNARVWLDGFTTFSPQSLKIIEKIIGLSLDTSISLTLDNNVRARDRDLFKLSRRSFRKIRAIAREQGLTEEIIVVSQDASLVKNPAIRHLESELYAYPCQTFLSELKDIELFAAANTNGEIEYVAAQILTLARERGYRWKDIAVVCHDMSKYSSLIKRVFNEYGIPYFIDQKNDIMNNPLIKLILSSLEVIRRGYRYQDVFALLKTGYSNLDNDQVEKMENFVLRYGIQGQRWKEDFSLDHQEGSLEEINSWRKIFIEPIHKLEARLSGRNTIASISRAYYEYLEDIGAQSRLETWIEQLNRQEHFDLVRENTQIWNIVLDILDQMVEILGDQEVTLKEYLRILEAGFLSLEVGIIPTTIDQVLVGNIQRSKSHDIRALLVIGINDGVLPSGRDDEGIFSETEKDMLLKLGVDLGFERNSKFEEERFLIYSALSKPSEYLGLSYAMADGEGKALRPSLLIDRFQTLLPSLELKSDLLKHRDHDLQQIANPNSSFKYLVENLRLQLDGKAIEDFWWDLYSWYYAQEDWQSSLESVIEALFHQNQANDIGTEKTRLLYSQPLHSTVSRLEQFVRCPFAHFVRYGLKPQERKVFTVGAPDIGELFHDCLWSFAKKLKQENINWFQLQKAECEQIMDGIMDEMVPVHGHGVFASTHRYQYLVKRLKRISRRAVWILTQHLQLGEFKPLDYEVSFGPGCPFPAIEIELDDGEKLYLVGRIDRVDLMDTDEGTFVKIIDYKSGSNDLILSDVYQGLTLQLMIYLQAVLASQFQLKRDKLKPGGVFYFKIDDPLIRTESRVISTIEKEIAKKLKMKGLVLKDVQLVRRLDREIVRGSEIIPVTLKTDDSFAKTSSVLAEEDFMALIQHVQGLSRGIGREIMSGKVKIEPFSSRKQTACSFCQYLSICQFDKLFEDNNYRNLRTMRDEEVINRVQGRKEVSGDATMD